MAMIISPTGSTHSNHHDIICQRYVLNDNQVSETFDLLDVDRDGKLSRIEIAALLRTVNVEPTRVELDFIFEEMDTEKTGKITKEDFISYMRSPPVRRTTFRELETWFRRYDADGDGAVTEEEMMAVLKQTTGLIDRIQVHEMFAATDTNRDGRISFHEFVKMMQQ
ncbi:hypothetical protein WR25_07276 [Diploscapter pachys]|uniref:EF-hand domain-containing protein n=1 Tax=Diploscapter pachys TaxID=2018661 RepID=A0A2A2KXY4_9BILA|nr:hypothetical protein WR25_07276 [Diploscapter pachys]